MFDLTYGFLLFLIWIWNVSKRRVLFVKVPYCHTGGINGVLTI